ncbi:glycoside hydrolase family protein [Rhizobium rhizogenes]|uniref:glycoside hydrolase family protein n=1 Tax=Rhizobium rhizogenes TaxID=359 RepID=UPI0015D4EB2F|nr:glycoside hydrolase family protein [Rhizobium rhizogenes]
MANKLAPSKRASALIASIVAVSVGGWVTIFPGQAPVHDDVALAIKVAAPWEGRALVAYLDTLPKPPRWTICEGDTDDVKPYQRATPAECDARIAKKMEKRYRPVLVSCRNIPDWDKRPLAWRGMMISLAWNIGAQGACSSTAAILGGKGSYIASCQAATAFNKSGGKFIIGLSLRREMGDAMRIGEGELCRSGV